MSAFIYPQKELGEQKGEAASLVSQHMVSHKNLQHDTKTTESLKHCLYWTEKKTLIILEQARRFEYTAFTRLHEYWCPDLWLFVKNPTRLL